VAQLSRDFRGEFDFVYLPIDFKNKCNVGYGFINFRLVESCERFIQMFDGVDVYKCLPGLNSKKVAEVTQARVHGLEENVRRLRNSPVMNELLEHPEWMPLLFDEEGSEVPFPAPEHVVAPVKPRRRAREDGEARREAAASKASKEEEGAQTQKEKPAAWRAGGQQREEDAGQRRTSGHRGRGKTGRSRR